MNVPGILGYYRCSLQMEALKWEVSTRVSTLLGIWPGLPDALRYPWFSFVHLPNLQPITAAIVVVMNVGICGNLPHYYSCVRVPPAAPMGLSSLPGWVRLSIPTHPYFRNL